MKTVMLEFTLSAKQIMILRRYREFIAKHEAGRYELDNEQLPMTISFPYSGADRNELFVSIFPFLMHKHGKRTCDILESYRLNPLGEMILEKLDES